MKVFFKNFLNGYIMPPLNAERHHFLSHFQAERNVSCSVILYSFVTFFHCSARNTSQRQSLRLRWHWDGRRELQRCRAYHRIEDPMFSL
ncbi:hypothetical protein QLX08_003122 [Tetragonisca angustula]|uniref:Uncharacterized protein n=1 Tax=Tetragonisca angustula TaxID=166442 RepID=A0AAW1A818_9HYME